MVIGTFHCGHVVKFISGQWLVTDPGMDILVNIYIYIYTSLFSNSMRSVLNCQMDTSQNFIVVILRIRVGGFYISPLLFSYVGRVAWELCYSLRPDLLYGNNLNRAKGIFNVLIYTWPLCGVQFLCVCHCQKMFGD